MKKRLAKLSRLLVAVSIMILAGAAGAGAGIQETQIKDIRFFRAATPGSAEKIQVFLSGKNIPKVTVLEGERPRIVIDFVNAGLPGRKNFTLDAGGDFVKRIRVGIHKNQMIRIVLDLVVGAGYIADQAFDHEENIYEIQVRPEKTLR